MKKLTLLIFLGLGFLLATAQENNEDERISTIFPKDGKNGGYGALSFSYTQIDGKDAFLAGARGSWIIDHSFAIGLGGCGFVNDVNYRNLSDNDLDYNLAGGYGGLYLEPSLHPGYPCTFQSRYCLEPVRLQIFRTTTTWITGTLMTPTAMFTLFLNRQLNSNLI